MKEDWRFSELRLKYGRHWWWISFFAVYISQHTMLLGLTLPVIAVSHSDKPFMTFWDNAAKLFCYMGEIQNTAYELFCFDVQCLKPDEKNISLWLQD